jgi:ABC-type lipoprotein release transport system permease subunit
MPTLVQDLRYSLRQLVNSPAFALTAVISLALGIAAAYGILAGIRLLLPRYAFAPEVVIRINLPVLCFSVAVALLILVAGIACFMPARRAAKLESMTALRCE